MPGESDLEAAIRRDRERNRAKASAPPKKKRRVRYVRRSKALWKKGERPPEEIWKKLRILVLLRDNFTCQYCGKTRKEALLQVDHIKPIALGGSNSLRNLVTACQGCNSKKSAKRLPGRERRKIVKGLMGRFIERRRRWIARQEEQREMDEAFSSAVARED